MIGIYKITSPSGKIYIGQSVDIKKRFKTYKSLRCKSQIKLYNSFLKHGVDNHVFEIIEECLVNELNEKERYYQDVSNVVSKNGLNLLLTKTKDRNGKMSEETRLKMSIAKIGKKHTQQAILNMKKVQSNRDKEWLENNKISCKNNSFSDISIARSMEANKGNKYNLGKKRTDETKLKMSLAKKGKQSPRKGAKLSQETKDKISNSKKKCKSSITIKF